MKFFLLMLLFSCSGQALKDTKLGTNKDDAMTIAELPKAPAPDKIVSFTEGGKTYQGKIYLPKNQKSSVKKIVIVVHEWWGANDYAMSRSNMLAESGIAAMSVDLYGNGITVETPDQAMAQAKPFYENPNLGVERLKKFKKLIKKDPDLKHANIYAIGYCFGGTQVLNLARSGEKLDGIASFHGGLTTSMKDVKKISTPLYVFNGEADPMVPKKDIDAFQGEMKNAHAHLQFFNYPGALHAFSNPKATEVGKKFNLPVAYDEKADKDSWEKLISFLKSN